MQTQNPFLEQFAKMMTEAAGAASSVREETENVFRRQLERLIADMDFVPREDFEAVREMAVLARAQNEALAARVEALEEKLGLKTAAADEDDE